MPVQSNLQFQEIANPDGKTKRVQLFSVRDHTGLGWIYFYPHWRRYVFHPQPGSIFDADCLGEVIAYLGRLNDERKEKVH